MTVYVIISSKSILFWWIASQIKRRFKEFVFESCDFKCSSIAVTHAALIRVYVASAFSLFNPLNKTPDLVYFFVLVLFQNPWRWFPDWSVKLYPFQLPSNLLTALWHVHFSLSASPHSLCKHYIPPRKIGLSMLLLCWAEMSLTWNR